jgi:hypothetical protein
LLNNLDKAAPQFSSVILLVALSGRHEASDLRTPSAGKWLARRPSGYDLSAAQPSIAKEIDEWRAVREIATKGEASKVRLVRLQRRRI